MDGGFHTDPTENLIKVPAGKSDPTTPLLTLIEVDVAVHDNPLLRF